MPGLGYNLYLPGDVAFLRGRAVSSKVNRVAQTAVRKQVARYSHVAISDGAGGFLHADVGTGVGFIYCDDLLDKGYAGFTAYRHRDLSQKISKDQERFFLATCYFLGQRYIREIDDSEFIKGARKFRGAELDFGETFCSKVINDIFKIFAPELALPDEKPLPVDLQTQVTGDGWLEVTDGHKLYFDHLRDNPDMKTHWLAAKQSVRAVRESDLRRREYTGMVQDIQTAANDLLSATGVKHPILDVGHEEPGGPIFFWDQKSKKKKE